MKMKLVIGLLTLVMSQLSFAIFPELIKLNIDKKDIIFSTIFSEDQAEINQIHPGLIDEARNNNPDAIDELFEIVREREMKRYGVDIADRIYPKPKPEEPVRNKFSKINLVFAIGFAGYEEEFEATYPGFFDRARNKDQKVIDTLFEEVRAIKFIGQGIDIAKQLEDGEVAGELSLTNIKVKISKRRWVTLSEYLYKSRLNYYFPDHVEKLRQRDQEAIDKIFEYIRVKRLKDIGVDIGELVAE
jgi:hypothetical protein